MTAEAYRRLEVPAQRLASAAARDAGRGLYRQHCSICHGERADGHGARRSGLSTAPRDYTDPVWRERTSPREVFLAIREGVPRTAMPAWSHLSDDDCWDLVAYVLSVAKQGP